MLSRKRLLSVLFTCVALVLTWVVLSWVRDSLGDESLFTGWVLLASTLGLYGLSARKKLAKTSMGPVAGWLQVHAYMGSFASVVFLMHVGWPVRGWFESALATVFVIVAVSGFWLGYISRTIPRKLGALGQDYRLEQIPAKIAVMADQAHSLALDSTKLGEGGTLAEYYQDRLLPFFASARGLVYRLFPNGYRRRKLVRELQGLDRYLGVSGVKYREEFGRMIQAKDDLDYHQALQYRLRLVFALHVALTWGMALMIAVHVVLALRFQGAMG